MRTPGIAQILAPFALTALLGAAACDRDPVLVDDNDDPVFTPRTPIELAVRGQGLFSGRYTAEVAARDTWVYTTTWGFRTAAGNALVIWDASGAVPVIRDTVIVAGATTLGDVQISEDGRLLVVATERNGGSIILYDRTVPDKLVEISRHSTPATTAGVHTVKLGVVNGRHYAFLSIDPASTKPAQLVIVDITDPRAPVEVLVRVMGLPFVHDVFVRDGLLFTALWDDGLTLWDIGGGGKGGTPANPVQLGNVKTVNGNVHNVWWFHDPATGSKRWVFVGEEGPGSVGASASGDIHVVDLSDMANPREVAFYSVPGAGTHNFVMDEASGILFAAYYNGGVRALDVRGDLGQCEAAAKAPDGRCNFGLAGREAANALSRLNVSVWGVARVGTALYASDMLSGVFKLDAAPLAR
jgi:hypothetical protein